MGFNWSSAHFVLPKKKAYKIRDVLYSYLGFHLQSPLRYIIDERWRWSWHLRRWTSRRHRHEGSRQGDQSRRSTRETHSWLQVYKLWFPAHQDTITGKRQLKIDSWFGWSALTKLVLQSELLWAMLTNLIAGDTQGFFYIRWGMCTLISRSTIRSPMIFFFKFRASYDGVS